jgi:hypothetical protein
VYFALVMPWTFNRKDLTGLHLFPVQLIDPQGQKLSLPVNLESTGNILFFGKGSLSPHRHPLLFIKDSTWYCIASSPLKAGLIDQLPTPR